METLFQDLRYGARMLLRSPGFTLVGVLTLALGIGANTAIFSVVKGVLLQPLPYREPQQLARLYETIDRTTMASDRMEIAPANFLDWRAQSQSFAGLAAFGLTGSVISEGGDAERLEGALVTADFFSVLGVAPLLGRAFTVEDEAARDRLVIIGSDLWKKRFGATKDVIGRQIQLDGFSFTVIGVTPSDLNFPRRTQVYELYRLNPNQRLMREAHFLKVIGRLKSGVSLAQAQGEMSSIAIRLAEQYPHTNRNWGASVVPLLEDEVGRVRPALLALLGAVGLVLLIACINTASLLLVRSANRKAEMSIRLALGAGRWRIIRQLLTESLLLAGLGGGAGLIVGRWAIEVLLWLAPDNLPRLENIQLDWGVLGFMLLLSLFTGVVFGFAPAWQAASQEVNASLKAASVTLSRKHRLLSALVASELALTMIVLIVAGLLVNSFLRLERVEPGIDVDRLLTVSFEPPSARYNGDNWKTERMNFWKELSTRVAALPGVEAVAAIDSLPFSGRGRVYRFRRIEEPDSNSTPAATFQVVTPDYFKATGIKLQRGRLLEESDSDQAPQVVVVNETMARRFWPSEDALGKRIFIRNDERPSEIVGVVSDVKHFGLEKEVAPEMYRPFQQVVIDVMPMVIRSSGGASSWATLATAIRREAKTVDPMVAVERVVPMSDLVGGTLAQRRYTMLLISVFAGTALLLAAVGIYGMISYSVSQRTREIGLRMALGAQKSDVLMMILGHGVRLTVIGLVMGLCGALALTGLIRQLLFGVGATDPLTFIGIAVLLTLTALVACWIPARRAVKVEPMIALRCD